MFFIYHEFSHQQWILCPWYVYLHLLVINLLTCGLPSHLLVPYSMQLTMGFFNFWKLYGWTFVLLGFFLSKMREFVYPKFGYKYPLTIFKFLQVFDNLLSLLSKLFSRDFATSFFRSLLEVLLKFKIQDAETFVLEIILDSFWRSVISSLPVEGLVALSRMTSWRDCVTPLTPRVRSINNFLIPA